MKIVFAMSVLLSLLLSGCGSSEQAAALTPKRALLGADVDVSQARPYQRTHLEKLPAPDDKLRVHITIEAAGADTAEQRAQTAMRAALDMVRGGAYEVLVWLDGAGGRLAVADYAPYGDTAWSLPAAHVWEVSAVNPQGVPDYLAPHLSTTPSDYGLM